MAISQILKVWQHELPHNEQAVALAMADHANEDGTGMWPSNARIAHKTGYAERTVQDIKSKLRERGLLIIVKKATRYRPTEYRFNWDSVEEKEAFEPSNQGCNINTPDETRGADTDARGAESTSSGVDARSPEPSKETSINRERARAREDESSKKLHPPVNGNHQTKGNSGDDEHWALALFRKKMLEGKQDLDYCDVSFYAQSKISATVSDRKAWKKAIEKGLMRDWEHTSVDAFLDHYERERSHSQVGDGSPSAKAFVPDEDGWSPYERKRQQELERMARAQGKKMPDPNAGRFK